MNLCTTIQEVLTQKGIEWGPTDQSNVLKFGLTGENGFFFAYAYVDEKERMVLVRTVVPLKVPREIRPAILMLLARINSHLPVGNFEMDLPSGVISCRTSIILGQSDCHPVLLDHLIGMNWYLIDHWFPAIRRAIIRNPSPQEAASQGGQQRHPGGRGGTDNDVPFPGRLGDILGGSMN